MLHLVEIAFHRLRALERRGKGQFESQSGQGRAQVVADRGQKRRTLVDMALDPFAHGKEGVGGRTHLACAMGLEIFAGLAPAEGLRGFGQSLDGAHLVADEQDGDAHQQDGSDRQPQDEDVGLGRHGPFARGNDAQYTLRLLHPDIDIGRVTGRIEPEGLVEAGREGLFEGAVDDPDRPASVLGRKGVTVP